MPNSLGAPKPFKEVSFSRVDKLQSAPSTQAESSIAGGAQNQNCPVHVSDASNMHPVYEFKSSPSTSPPATAPSFSMASAGVSPSSSVSSSSALASSSASSASLLKSTRKEQRAQPASIQPSLNPSTNKNAVAAKVESSKTPVPKSLISSPDSNASATLTASEQKGRKISTDTDSGIPEPGSTFKPSESGKLTVASTPISAQLKPTSSPPTAKSDTPNEGTKLIQSSTLIASPAVSKAVDKFSTAPLPPLTMKSEHSDAAAKSSSSPAKTAFSTGKKATNAAMPSSQSLPTKESSPADTTSKFAPSSVKSTSGLGLNQGTKMSKPLASSNLTPRENQFKQSPFMQSKSQFESLRPTLPKPKPAVSDVLPSKNPPTEPNKEAALPTSATGDKQPSNGTDPTSNRMPPVAGMKRARDESIGTKNPPASKSDMNSKGQENTPLVGQDEISRPAARRKLDSIAPQESITHSTPRRAGDVAAGSRAGSSGTAVELSQNSKAVPPVTKGVEISENKESAIATNASNMVGSGATRIASPINADTGSPASALVENGTAVGTSADNSSGQLLRKPSLSEDNLFPGARKISQEWLDEKMPKSEWREMRHSVFNSPTSTDVEQLAFKILQEILLSPVRGIQFDALKPLSNAIMTGIPNHYAVPQEGVFARFSDLLKVMNGQNYKFRQGDLNWMKDQTPESLAVALFEENVDFVFKTYEDGECVQQQTKEQFPSRGAFGTRRIPDRMSTGQDGDRLARYNDSVSDDMLFNSLFNYLASRDNN